MSQLKTSTSMSFDAGILLGQFERTNPPTLEEIAQWTEWHSERIKMLFGELQDRGFVGSPQLALLPAGKEALKMLRDKGLGGA